MLNLYFYIIINNQYIQIMKTCTAVYIRLRFLKTLALVAKTSNK